MRTRSRVTIQLSRVVKSGEEAQYDCSIGSRRLSQFSRFISPLHALHYSVATAGRRVSDAEIERRCSGSSKGPVDRQRMKYSVLVSAGWCPVDFIHVQLPIAAAAARKKQAATACVSLRSLLCVAHIVPHGFSIREIQNLIHRNSFHHTVGYCLVAVFGFVCPSGLAISACSRMNMSLAQEGFIM